MNTDNMEKTIETMCKLLGKNIRILRNKRMWTIKTLAKYLSISESYLGLLERGGRNPSFILLIRISLVFEVSIDWLLGFNNKPLQDYIARKENTRIKANYAVSELIDTLKKYDFI